MKFRIPWNEWARLLKMKIWLSKISRLTGGNRNYVQKRYKWFQLDFSRAVKIILNPWMLKDQPGHLSQLSPVLPQRERRQGASGTCSQAGIEPQCCCGPASQSHILCPTAGLSQGHCASLRLPCSLAGPIDKYISQYHQLWGNFLSPFLQVLIDFLLVNVLCGMLGH